MKGNLLKEIRQFKDMTQEQFADWLGVSLSSIALVESGHRGISENLENKITHKFDVTDPNFIEYKKQRKKTGDYFLRQNN